MQESGKLGIRQLAISLGEETEDGYKYQLLRFRKQPRSIKVISTITS